LRRPEPLGIQVIDARATGLRHGVVELGTLQRDAGVGPGLRPQRRAGKHERPPQQDKIGSRDQRLGDVTATAHTAVEQQRIVGADHLPN